MLAIIDFIENTNVECLENPRYEVPQEYYSHEYNAEFDQKWIEFRRTHNVKPSEYERWFDMYLRMCGCGLL